MEPFRIGTLIVFDYPDPAAKGPPPPHVPPGRRLRRRRLRIERVEEPLEPPADGQGEPATLVIGLDLDRQKEERFVAAVMVGVRILERPSGEPPDAYRVALLEPGCQPELVYASGELRDVLVWAREWLREPVELGLGIFPPGVAAKR